MKQESTFSEIVTIFEKARPAIECGINSMQPPNRKEAEQIWQELVEMVENKENNIIKFSDKLREFNKCVYEYQIRAQILASSAQMDTI